MVAPPSVLAEKLAESQMLIRYMSASPVPMRPWIAFSAPLPLTAAAVAGRSPTSPAHGSTYVPGPGGGCGATLLQLMLSTPVPVLADVDVTVQPVAPKVE